MEGKGESNELCTITIPVFSIQCSGMIASSGLACVSSGHDQIYLCNPVMQQLRKLPKCSCTQLFVPSIFGFGYLHSTKEYKVVNFFYTCPAGNIPGLTAPSLFQLRCEVFTFTSLTNGQIWKETAETPPCHPDSRGLLVKECLYWLGRPRVTATSDRILSFDFEEGKFLTIAYPPSIGSISFLSLMDMKGMFCVPDMKHLMKSSMLHLWILKDKVSCNWVKEYSINLVSFLPRFIFPVFKAWNEGITFICDDEVLVFYDLKTKLHCTIQNWFWSFP